MILYLNLFGAWWPEVSKLSFSDNENPRSTFSFGHELTLEESHLVFLKHSYLSLSKQLIQFFPGHGTEILRTFPKIDLFFNGAVPQSFNIQVFLIVQNTDKLSFTYADSSICDYLHISWIFFIESQNKRMFAVLRSWNLSGSLSHLQVEGHHLYFFFGVGGKAIGDAPEDEAMFLGISFFIVFIEGGEELGWWCTYHQINLIIYQRLFDEGKR